MPKKTVRQRATTTAPTLKKQKHGGALLSGGKPGHKGGGGRPSDEWRAWCSKQLKNPKIRKRIRRFLRLGSERTVLDLIKLMEARAFGPPAQKIIEAKASLAQLLAGDDEPEE
jgi:hypothetical protein